MKKIIMLGFILAILMGCSLYEHGEITGEVIFHEIEGTGGFLGGGSYFVQVESKTGERCLFDNKWLFQGTTNGTMVWVKYTGCPNGSNMVDEWQSK